MAIMMTTFLLVKYLQRPDMNNNRTQNTRYKSEVITLDEEHAIDLRRQDQSV